MRTAVAALLIASLAATSTAQVRRSFEGVLRITKAGKGRIEQSGAATGRGSFTIGGLELIPADDSDGFSFAAESIIITVGTEQFLIPAGVVKVSRSQRRVQLRDKRETRGVRALTFVLGKDGLYRAKLLMVGLELSALIANREQLPLCAWFGIRVGNDDMVQGLSFDVPKPAPAKRLTLPGFCTDISNAW